MAEKRLLTIQDISCVGQCSMTVALPILTACGLETCVLPSSVLSSHTGGFSHVSARNLADAFPEFWENWKKEDIHFDAVYTGYLGSTNHVAALLEMMSDFDGMLLVDPAMADHGVLYRGFDKEYLAAMTKLCRRADILIPNITEACMLTGMQFRESYDETYIDHLLTELGKLGCGCVVLTGVSFTPDTTGVMIARGGENTYYPHRRLAKNFHGTGDIFASAFVGTYLQDKALEEAVKIAAEYTVLSMEKTLEYPEHWYGVKFETMLPWLISKIRGE